MSPAFWQRLCNWDLETKKTYLEPKYILCRVVGPLIDLDVALGSPSPYPKKVQVEEIRVLCNIPGWLCKK